MMLSIFGKKWKTRLLPVAVALVIGLLLLGYLGRQVYRQHVRLLDNIKLATANPNGLTPGAMVNRLDSGFAALPEDEKQRILADPKLLSDRIEKAAYNNYKQAFGNLFMLPEPIRKKLISRSAEAIATSLSRNPAKVNAFYDSEAGKAALRAASNYFMTEMDGRQKAELKPITDAFFKIHQERTRKKGTS